MNINLLEEPLVCALLDETIPFHEVMSAFNIDVQVAFNLPSYIKGFVYVSSRDNYFIIMNGNLNYQEQCITLVHEIKHIVEDIPTTTYYIGINGQHNELEDDTNMFAVLNSIV